jgi:ADP-heptose:LPS heptosyltransferase
MMLIGGPADRSRGDAIAAVDPIKIYNACGKFSFHESADLVRRSKLVVSHDTGMMQVAAALQKPLIVIWGSTTPQLTKTPFFPDAVNHRDPPMLDHFQREKQWCRPCTIDGKEACPLGHFHCMKKLPVETLLSLVQRRLAKPSASAFLP